MVNEDTTELLCRPESLATEAAVFTFKLFNCKENLVHNP